MDDKVHMDSLKCILMTAALVAGCAASASAAAKTPLPSFNYAPAQAQPTQTLGDAKSELAQDMSLKATDIVLLTAAQSALDASFTHAEIVRDTASALEETATKLRHNAYALTDLPGLSASQNHKSVAAMEAADAAENAAGFAQSDVTSAAAALAQDRDVRDRLSNQILVLTARVAVCTRTIQLYDVTKRRAASTVIPTSFASLDRTSRHTGSL
jgi:hypothetical protein